MMSRESYYSVINYYVSQFRVNIEANCMEKKLKVSEFASLIGVTQKTVYRMIEREEVKTVIEKVNNRQTTLILTNDEEIKCHRIIYGKDTDNDGNCEDILTVNDEFITDNNRSQTNNNNNSSDKALQIMMELNDKLNDKLEKVNNELIESKSKQLLLAHHESRESFYLEEINGLRTENKQLLNDKDKQYKTSMIVILVLSIVIVGLITFNIVSSMFNNKNIKSDDANISKIENVAPTGDKISPVQPNKKK